MLVAVGHPHRDGGDAGRQGHRAILGQRDADHVRVRDQVRPRLVGAQERREARHAIYRHAAGVDGLAPEVQQAGIVTDVGMGEQDAIEARDVRVRRDRVQHPELRPEVRRRVEEPARA